MRKSPPPIFHPTGRLEITEKSLNSVRLASRRETVEISVLAANLFRLRIARGPSLSRRPSWAVVKTDWLAAPARIWRSKNQLTAETSQSTLTLRLSDGRWDLSDARGHPLFTAEGGATGFAGEEARLTLSLADGESIFGLGETTGTFNKRGLIREFWNSDVLGHAPAIHPSLRNLYVSIPFAISLREGRAAGL